MSVFLSPVGNGDHWLGANALPANGGLINTYLAGTTTPAATYTTSLGDVANTNPIVLTPAGIPPFEIWLTGGVSYKFIITDIFGVQIGPPYDNIYGIGDLTAPNVNNALNVSYIQLGTGAVTTTVAGKLNQYVSVFDFMTTLQISDVQAGTLLKDVTTPIQNAINSLASGGLLFFPPGQYKFTSTLTCVKPVIWQGSGCGETSTNSSPHPTRLVWAGGSSDAVHYGGFGTTFAGGGINNLCIDGQSLATNCLVTKDIWAPRFFNIEVCNSTTNGWLVTNTLGQPVTGFFEASYIRIYQASSGATASANGLALQGVTGGVSDGVTLGRWKRCRIDHNNGAGVLIGTSGGGTQDAGDGMSWYDLFTFRPNTGTGFGVNFQSANTSSIINQHRFYGPQVTGGFNFATPTLSYGTRIINGSEVDLNTNVTQLLSGAGAIDVACDTQSGVYFGRQVIPNLHTSIISDAFFFTRYDSANGILQTGNGNWTVINASGGTLTDAGTPGGGVTVTTAAVNTSVVGIELPSGNASSGLRSVVSPMMSCNFVLTQAVGTQLRIGFFDGFGAVIANGVYIEYDNAVSNFWRFVCVKASVSTIITLPIGPNIGTVFEWAIRFDQTFATANYRAGGFTGIGNAGVTSTNIPTVAMFFGVAIRTNAVAAKSVTINSMKAGFLDENYPQT
jgi:hypothetical protein